PLNLDRNGVATSPGLTTARGKRSFHHLRNTLPSLNRDSWVDRRTERRARMVAARRPVPDRG
ncbi:MAG: hypothetical protein ABSF71_35475, partial [Terriglobia bacterium]